MSAEATSQRRAGLSPQRQALLDKLRTGGLGGRETDEKNVLKRRAGDAPAPLSFSQKRLWFLQQMSPYKAAHNLPRCLRLVGPLDAGALRRALGEIVRRHEVLRSRFPVEDGPARQYVIPRLDLDVPVVDLEALGETAGLAEAVRLGEADGQYVFDLDTGPPIKLMILRLDRENHVLAVLLHHIVSDGWSFGVFMRELSALYAAYCEGRPSPLPELPLQYADFAAWQRDWLDGEVLERQLGYWKNRLAGAPMVLELPTDRPRPLVSSFRGGSLEFVLSAEVHEGLQSLSRRHGASLFMTLLAIFEVLLFRQTGRKDLLVGTPIANRTREELEGLIGFFVNTLVVRNDLSGDPPFSRLLQAVRDETLEAYSHQDLPFERLVEELPLEREVNRPPVVQVMFVHQNYPTEGFALKDLELRRFDSEGGNTTRDLTLVMQGYGRGMIGWLEYSLDLYEPTTIRRILGHFRHLIDGVLASPETPLSRLPLLGDGERHQMLVEWNDTAAAVRSPAFPHQRFEAWAERLGDAAPAVVMDEEEISYRELDESANRLARHLRRHGVGLDDPVALCLERSVEILVAMLAVLKAGGAYVFLDPEYPPKRLAGMIDDAGARWLVSRRKLAVRFPEPRPELVLLDADAETIAARDGSDLGLEIPAKGRAYVVFTSGSTGRPKGVEVEHGTLRNYVDAVLPRLHVGERASYATLSTFSADLGNTAIYEALGNGGTLHVISRENAADPDGLGAYLRRRPVDCFKYVPPHLEALLASAEDPRDVLPRCQLILGGDTMTWEMIRRIRDGSRCGVLNHYGHTETTIGAVTRSVRPADDAPEGARGAVAVGRPMANSRVYLADARLEPVPAGVGAELYLAGDQVSRGYANRPDITAERFVPDPWSPIPGARMYRSGDLVKYLPDGNLFFIGRVDHQVKIRGYRVELEEIETILAAQAGVGEVVVMVRELVREDSPGDPRLVAWLTPDREHTTDDLRVPDLRDGLKELLPDYMIPAAFVVLAAFPLTANGKLDRKALPSPSAERPELEVGFAAPKTDLERELAAVWCEVLGLEKVGVEDNFFDAGGNSLLLIQVYTRLWRRHPYTVTILDMMQSPTVRSLAALIERRLASTETGTAETGDAEPDAESATERRRAGRNRLRRSLARRRGDRDASDS